MLHLLYVFFISFSSGSRLGFKDSKEADTVVVFFDFVVSFGYRLVLRFSRDMGLCWVLWWFCVNFSFNLGHFLFDFFYTSGDCLCICPFSCACNLVEHTIALIVLYAGVAHKENILANILDAIYSLFAHSSAAGCVIHRVTTRDTVKTSSQLMIFIRRRRFPLLRSTQETKRLSRMETGCSFVSSASKFKSFFLFGRIGP